MEIHNETPEAVEEDPTPWPEHPDKQVNVYFEDMRLSDKSGKSTIIPCIDLTPGRQLYSQIYLTPKDDMFKMNVFIRGSKSINKLATLEKHFKSSVFDKLDLSDRFTM